MKSIPTMIVKTLSINSLNMIESKQIVLTEREICLYNALITLVSKLSVDVNSNVLDNLADCFKQYEENLEQSSGSIPSEHKNITMVCKWTVNIANEVFKAKVDLYTLQIDLNNPYSPAQSRPK